MHYCSYYVYNKCNNTVTRKASSQLQPFRISWVIFASVGLDEKTCRKSRTKRGLINDFRIQGNEALRLASLQNKTRNTHIAIKLKGKTLEPDKYYYAHDNNTFCKELCKIINDGTMIGSGACKKCKYCLGFLCDEHWIMCQHIKEASNMFAKDYPSFTSQIQNNKIHTGNERY